MSSAQPPPMHSPPMRELPSDWASYTPGDTFLEGRFPVDARAPAACRDFARSALAATGRTLPRDVVDSVMIVVAELVTAAYLASATCVRVGIEAREDDVVVTVRDDRPAEWRRHARRNDTREMLLDALTVFRRSFAEATGTVHVARLLSIR